MKAGTDTGRTKRDVLNALNFGARVAEEEKEGLADYFVETDQWKKVVSGDVDVVFGPKGSGKSAIYTSLMNRDRAFADDGILLITAEKPRGSTVFRSLVADPPTGEVEFVSIWKLYILSMLGSVIADYGMVGEDADRVRHALYQEGLLDDSIEKVFLAGTAGMVYHSTVGPISLSFNYYDDPENQFGVLLHVGFLLFNKTSME